jgi:hypothetical protein
MAGTRAFEVKKVLYDKLKVLVGPGAGSDARMSNVEIWYGYEVPGELPRETVWLGEIQWTPDDRSVSLGGLKRDETFRIVTTIEVHNPDMTQYESNERAKEIMQSIEDLIRDPRWTGLTNILNSQMLPQFLGEGMNSNATGRGSILVTLVEVEARK